MKQSEKNIPAINSSPFADIAFLLLIFFLVTTTIKEDKGLTIQLPPKPQEVQTTNIHDKNLFKVQINSRDEVMVEGELKNSILNLREEVKKFILNKGKNPELSDNPTKAVISLKTNRATSYERYIEVLDELQAAYYEIYSSRVGITPQEFRNLDLKNPKQRVTYLNAKNGIPMNISIAEPTN